MVVQVYYSVTAKKLWIAAEIFR